MPRTGGPSYLPIDPALPAARIGFMLADAAPIAAITSTGLADRLDGCDLLVIVAAAITAPTNMALIATTFPRGRHATLRRRCSARCGMSAR